MRGRGIELSMESYGLDSRVTDELLRPNVGKSSFGIRQRKGEYISEMQLR